MVSYSQWESNRHFELLHRFFVFTGFLSRRSLRRSLFFGCFAAELDSWYCVESESSSAVCSLTVYQRKRVSRPASTLGCPNLVDFISNTALSFLEVNMQCVLLKSEERKSIEVLFGSACMYVDPICVKAIG